MACGLGSAPRELCSGTVPTALQRRRIQIVSGKDKERIARNAALSDHSIRYQAISRHSLSTHIYVGHIRILMRQYQSLKVRVDVLEHAIVYLGVVTGESRRIYDLYFS